MTELRNKKITVIGAERSGIPAAILAAKKGAKVLISDNAKKEIDKNKFDELVNLGIEIELGVHSSKVYDCDFIVTSPGVAIKSEVLQNAFSKRIPVYSEIEFASWFNKGKIIAITGTNGKTTTTALTHYIFKNAGFETFLGGNIGDAFSGFVDQTSEDSISVLEVSSYQLDLIDSFHPKVAIILNITPDHLYRYENSFQKYVESKFRITKNLQEEDLFIFNLDDSSITNNIPDLNSKRETFSIIDFDNADAFYREEVIYLRNSIENGINQSKVFPFINTRQMILKGVHNYYNSMAAILAARFFGCSLNKIREGIETFKGVEHRLEVVRQLNGILFINDSKATNVRSTYYALKSYDSPLILILGGREKGDGNDYSEILELVKEKVKVILAFGETKEKIKNFFDKVVEVIVCESLEEVVKKSYDIANKGDIVMFSPACKSFDMFKNYEHRGRSFKELVNRL